MSVPLPHPPIFRARALTIAALIVPVALTTDSVFHALVIAGAALLCGFLCRGLSRVLARTPAVRDVSILIAAAALANVIDLLLNAFFFNVYRSMNLVAPVILTSAVVATLWDQADVEEPLWQEVVLAITGIVLVGLAREIVGHGSLLHDVGAGWSLTLFNPEMGFFLAVLAPGAFIALGIVLALLNWWRERRT